MTKEQIKWFWEKCGLTYFDGWFYSPEGERLFEYGAPIDIWALPYLFKYAVPKLHFYIIKMIWVGIWVVSINDSFKQWVAEDKDPAIALFWAIYKALGE